MKIGLVTPYVYPLPGGVNEHVHYLYEGLRERGHDVRIISSSHGLQRASEGDVIRLGKGFSFPTNGSVGTVTLSPRYLSQVADMLEFERFDLLHFHEPFVPFLSPIVLRASTSVNVATFHAYGGWSAAYEFGSRAMRRYAERLHGRIAVSAAARHFIDRYFPGDYKVIPNGVNVAKYRRAVPLARWHDGEGHRPSILGDVDAIGNDLVVAREVAVDEVAGRRADGDPAVQPLGIAAHRPAAELVGRRPPAVGVERRDVHARGRPQHDRRQERHERLVEMEQVEAFELEHVGDLGQVARRERHGPDRSVRGETEALAQADHVAFGGSLEAVTG